jgi:hypothetical protein
MTAIGTVAVAVVAVWVAFYTERQADKRMRDERKHSEKRLREERERSDTRLAEERQLFQDREQFAAACAVQVTLMRGFVQSKGEDEAQQLIAVVVNHGTQTITRIVVRFSPDGESVAPARQRERLHAELNLPAEARVAQRFGPSAERGPFADRLTPWDMGITAETDLIKVRRLTEPRVTVRWTDGWGTRWQHKRGDVKKVDESAKWEF